MALHGINWMYEQGCYLRNIRITKGSAINDLGAEENSKMNFFLGIVSPIFFPQKRLSKIKPETFFHRS